MSIEVKKIVFVCSVIIVILSIALGFMIGDTLVEDIKTSLGFIGVAFLLVFTFGGLISFADKFFKD